LGQVISSKEYRSGEGVGTCAYGNYYDQSMLHHIGIASLSIQACRDACGLAWGVGT